MPISELRTGDVLITPARLPFGKEEPDQDRAYVEGLYISDGWSDDQAFSISGKDGFPKENQKREVQEICTRLGIPTRWDKRYIDVKNKPWAQRMQQMGKRARLKHALSIDLTEGPAAGLLRGIMADSGANTNGDGRTFTTTSHQLFLQTRTLLKMFARSAGESYIVDHGGLGKYPIWRLFIRGRTDGKHEKLLRVRSVEKGITSANCYDITTSSGFVYLPEADVSISNCDDFSSTLVALLGSAGYQTKLRVIQTTAASDWNHIFVLVNIPSTTRWIPLDASVSKPPGWHAPKSMIKRYRDFMVV